MHPSRALLVIVGAVTAVFIANLYYAQLLAGIIAGDIRIDPGYAGAVVSVSQFGYGLGLFLLVPLADIVENRRLVLICAAMVVAALIGLATSGGALSFLCCGALAGVASSGAHVLVPYLTHRLPLAIRGRVLGLIGAGVLTGVMLARPLALFVTAEAGWRAVYWGAAITTAVLGLSLAAVMVPQAPASPVRYGQVIRSMLALHVADHRLRRRTFCQAAIFASFTLFWATVPMVLAERFGLGVEAVGLFALVGAGGALMAPVAGRLADAGHSRRGMIVALALIIVCFTGSVWAVEAAALAALALIALLLDGAVQATQTFSRLLILEVDAGIRGRVNGLYMAIVYLCGAVGSLAGIFVTARLGWTGGAVLGAFLAAGALLAVLLDVCARADT